MAEVLVPELGESISEATIGKWLKDVGEHVEADEPLVDLETDKVTVQVPAPTAGTITERRASEGDTVAVGDVIALFEAGQAEAAAKDDEQAPTNGKGGASKQAKQPEQGRKPQKSVEARGSDDGEPAARKAKRAQKGVGDKPEENIVHREDEARAEGAEAGAGASDRRLTPSQRRAAREGRQVAQPRQSQAAAAPRPQPAAQAEPGDREEVVAMTTLRKRIAERLVEAQQTAAILTTFNEVDMSRVMALRSEIKQAFLDKHGIKLGFMSFFVKAVIAALQDFPGLNAEVKGESIVYKKYYNIGIAVGGGKGLVVPVLRDADRMGFAEIEAAIVEKAQKAQKNTLKLDELMGGTFTISNGGVYGSMMSTPLLNFPQTGILGMHNIVERPIAVDGRVELRPMMYVALSYDHRVVDGREAVQFLVGLKQRIEQPDRLMFDL